MNWHTEGIGAAIAEAKSRGEIFAVFVKSPPEAAQEETQSLETALLDEEVVSQLSNMVCIEVNAGSTTCAQFSAIYPVMVVPSVYFIDSTTGVDLEITGGLVTKDSLLESVARARKRLTEPGTLAPVPAASSAPTATSAPAPPSAPAPTSAAATVSEESVPTAGSTPIAAKNESSSQQASLDERVARAKMLVQQRQAEREKEEEEKEKNREMERRKLGQALLEQKRTKDEEELKKAALERKKDKEEEKKAREAVKAAIEQDRLARKAKYDEEKSAADERKAEAERANLAAAAAAAQVSAAERALVARIQFRLPDGRNQTKQFPAETPLSELYTFVTTIEPGFTSFSLSTTFPRRQLDAEEPSASLRDLQMAPSATVLVLPKASTSVSLPGGDLSSFLWLLLSPFTILWAMITSFFGGVTATAQNPNNSSTSRPSTSRPGGIGRLRRSEDDDENNTYNGNSTQQM